MTILRSCLFQFFYYGFTTVFVCLYLPVMMLPVRISKVGIKFWASSIVNMASVLAGVRFEIEGGENLPAGPAIIASKHQSAWETIAFLSLFDIPAIVLKQELLSMPFIGWYMRKLGMIAIDRAGGIQALKRLLDLAKAAIAEGRVVLVFPEGSRAAPGSRLPYRAGVGAMYNALGVDVVPVALNTGLFWGRRRFLLTPGRITIRILPAIAPGLERRSFMAQLEDRIERASDTLLDQAGAIGCDKEAAADEMH